MAVNDGGMATVTVGTAYTENHCKKKKGKDK